tara:strand:- start:858 stop:1352 length:495 start_codon:yes stop_codon:yes gene_type:complete
MKNKLHTIIRNLIFPFILLLLSIFTYYIVNNKTIFIEDNTDLNMLMTQTKSEKTTGKKIQLEVLNGCGTKGVAILFTNFLRSNGYDVINFKNAENFNFNKTKIIIHKHDAKNFVNEIIDILALDSKQIEYNFDKNIFYEMTLIIGSDYKKLNSFSEVAMHYNPF